MLIAYHINFNAIGSVVTIKMDHKDICRLCLNENNMGYDLFVAGNKNELLHRLEAILRLTVSAEFFNQDKYLAFTFYSAHFQLTEIQDWPSKVCTECMICINTFERYREAVKSNQEQIFQRFGVQQLKCEPTVFVQDHADVESEQHEPAVGPVPEETVSEVVKATKPSDCEGRSRGRKKHSSHNSTEEKKEEDTQNEIEKDNIETEPDAQQSDEQSADDNDDEFLVDNESISEDTDGEDDLPLVRNRTKSKSNTSSERKTENLDEPGNNKKRRWRDLSELTPIMQKLNLLNCALCDKRDMKDWDELRAHYKDAHKMRGYALCCGRKLKERWFIYDHLKYHEYGPQYTCTICDKGFRQNQTLKMHIKVVHEKQGERTFGCSECDKKFKTAAALQYHSTTHLGEEARIHKCDECVKSFKVESNLTKHKAMCHSKLSRRFICDECGERFMMLSHLQAHLKRHDPTREKVVCGLCGKYVLHLESHMRLVHSTVDESATCHECGAVLKSKKNLERHKKRVHDKNGLVHPCSVCAKLFFTKQRLNEHISTHTGIKQYTCHFCHDQFAAVTNRSKHMKMRHAEEYEKWKYDKFYKPAPN